MNFKQRLFFWTLILLCSLFFLFQLGKLPLYDYDEAHYAQVVQQTLQSDDLLTFKRLGGEWFEKPPLLLWLSMGSVALFGESEFTMRLPTALFGIAAIWGTYLLTLFLTKNYWAALGAGFVLLFSGMFPAAGRQLRMDAPLAAAIVFAVHSFVKGWEKPKWYLGFWIWTAIGLLLKSVPALFTGPIVLIFSAVYRRWDWLKNGYFWLGIPLFFALVAPWHIYETIKFGSRFWDSYFGFHILRRATEKILGGNVTNWDYLKHFLFLNEPWFMLAIVVGVLLIVYHHKQFPEFRLAVASFLSGTFIFLAFALAKTKLMFYLIPILPFEAVAIAAGTLFLFHAAAWQYKKEIFVAVGSIAFLAAVVSTSAQLFYFRAPYSYAYADDEREVGKLIKQYDRGHALYSFDWRAYETIYYYSGRKHIELVEQEQLKTGFSPPYFLIMPRPYLRNREQTGLALRYEGRYLVLLEAGVPESAKKEK